MESPAFSGNGDIPRRYTCEGSNISPPLSWKGAPSSTESFVLIVDDPDAPDPKAPKRTFVHWVVYNIPASVTSLGEGVRTLPAGARAGLNDVKENGYRGPCPPIGTYRKKR